MPTTVVTQQNNVVPLKASSSSGKDKEMKPMRKSLRMLLYSSIPLLASLSLAYFCIYGRADADAAAETDAMVKDNGYGEDTNEFLHNKTFRDYVKDIYHQKDERFNFILSFLQPRVALSLDPADLSSPDSIIGKFLVPRPVGSIRHVKLQHWIISFFASLRASSRSLAWTLFRDSFTQETVIGRQTFTNYVALSTLDAKNYIVLSAHYDSKRVNLSRGVRPDLETFIGATDSAASCALLLALAQSFTTMADKLADRGQRPSYGIQLILFDGEEAFKDWSAEDSLYGSKHLAGIYKKNVTTMMDLPLDVVVPSTGVSPFTETLAFTSKAVRLFVLLDLLGAKGFHRMINFSRQTSSYFQLLAFLEQTLLSLPPQQQSAVDAIIDDVDLEESSSLYFRNVSGFGISVDDDHKPFQALSIPILHLIPVPYPNVWHTMGDSLSALNQTSVLKWEKLLMLFISYVAFNLS